jgi:MATE family multidrug resistance protein
MMGYFGAIALAAHQIVTQWVEISFMMLTGIAQATGIRIAYQMGAKQLHLVKYIAHRGLLLGLIVAVIFSTGYLLLPDIMTKFFIEAGNREVIFAYSRQFFFVAIFFQLFDALQIISGGMLRGIKDTFVPMFLGLSSYWIIGVSAGLLFAFVFNWGAVGLWYGLVLGIASSGAMLYWRFRFSLRRMVK